MKAPWVAQAQEMDARGVLRRDIAKAIGVSASRISTVLNPKKTTEVPAWVPADLHKKYLTLARQAGEEEAAAWARAEKRARGASNGRSAV